MGVADIVKRIQTEVASGGPQSSGELLQRLNDVQIGSDTLAVAIGFGLEHGELRLNDQYRVESVLADSPR